MQQLFFLMLLVISTATVCTAQSISGNGFEVHTRLKHPKAKLSTVNRDSIVARINAIPDTALQTATFVFTAADISDITAIELALIDSRNHKDWETDSLSVERLDSKLHTQIQER